jgi:hypothetical protein
VRSLKIKSFPGSNVLNCEGSANMLNEFRVGFNRVASIRGPANGVPSVRTLGVNIPYQPPANDVQSVNVSGFFNFGDNPFARFTRNNFLLTTICAGCSAITTSALAWILVGGRSFSIMDLIRRVFSLLTETTRISRCRIFCLATSTSSSRPRASSRIRTPGIWDFLFRTITK